MKTSLIDASVDIVDDEGSLEVFPKAEFLSPFYVHITLATDTEAELLVTAAIKNILKYLAFKWLLNQSLLETECSKVMLI